MQESIKNKAYYLMTQNPGKIKVIYECGHNKPKVKHHPDYDDPFTVELLCHSCHWHRHKQLNPEFGNMATKEIKTQVQARLSIELVAVIDKLAEKNMRSRANMIEWMLIEMSKDFSELNKQEAD